MLKLHDSAENVTFLGINHIYLQTAHINLRTIVLGLNPN